MARLFRWGTLISTRTIPKTCWTFRIVTPKTLNWILIKIIFICFRKIPKEEANSVLGIYFIVVWSCLFCMTIISLMRRQVLFSKAMASTESRSLGLVRKNIEVNLSQLSPVYSTQKRAKGYWYPVRQIIELWPPHNE